MAHLTAEQWQQIREIWEGDPREGFAWLVKDLELDISRQRLAAKAASEGWGKRGISSADKDLGAKRGKKPKSAESRSKRPPSAGRKSSTERTGASYLQGSDKGSEAKASDPESSSEEPDEAFKKTERAKRAPRKRGANSARPKQHESNQSNSDSSKQSFKRTEIDIFRERFGGRPAEYRYEYAELAHKQCLLYGATDDQLASFFEVSLRTIHYWKANYPQFLHAVKTGKSIADGNVAYGLYQRAVGMTIPDVHVSNYQGQVIITDIKKVIPPDVAAASFWLRNRQREHWQSDPEPPAQDTASLYPTEEEMEAQLSVSRAITESKAAVARERRDRLGICTPNSSVPADATLMPKRRVQARDDHLADVTDIDDDDLEGDG